MQSSAPMLVIVAGAPASGKSTLARRLAADLGMPMLSRDELKERLADAIGAPTDVTGSSRLGAGAYAMLYHMAAALLGAGASVVVESNFRRGLSERELRPLASAAAGVLVHCMAPADVLERRYRQRFETGSRHVAHLDGQRAAALAHDLAAGRFEPLDLGLPLIRAEFDTTWSPRYEEIREWITRAAGSGA